MDREESKLKKFIICLLAVSLLLGLAACASGGSESSNPKITEPGATEPGHENAFYFTYRNTEIRLYAPAEPIVAALGEPMSYTEETSCAFEGLDKTYYYGSFYLNTYPQDGKDYVYGFWFMDDGIQTNEGIYIGASKAQVESAYGADTFNGANAYVVKRDGGVLTVILENDVVSSIQYAIELG